MKFKKWLQQKTAILSAIILLASMPTAFAIQPDITSDSDFWTRIGSNSILPISTSEELGASGSRIAKIYATALDASSLVLGGITFSGDIDSTGTAIDWDLFDNSSSALSFDAVGKSGILNIDTTDTAEGISTSGYLTSSGAITGGSLTDGTATLTGGALNALASVDATTESTIEAAIDTLANLTSFGSSTGVAYTTGGTLSYKTIGVGDDNIVETDDASIATNDFAKFTANGIEGRTYTETKQDLSLDNVENTALSTWGGTSNIATLGTVTTGTWNAGAVTSSGAVQGSSLTDGVLSITGGNISSAGTVTATSFVGDLTGQSSTVATITGLAPDTATTAAAQPNITSLGTLTGLSLSGDVTTTNAIGRDVDNEIAWTTDNQLDITIAGVTTQLTSIATGTADNDKLVTQGYVDDNAGGGGVSTLQEAFDGGQTITIADTDNQTLAITNNDTTNNPKTLTITDTTNSEALEITSSVTTGTAAKITVDSLTTGTGLQVYSNSGDNVFRNLVEIVNDNSLAFNSTLLYLNQDSTGTALHIDSNSHNADGAVLIENFSNAPSLKIQPQGASTHPALYINSLNSGLSTAHLLTIETGSGGRSVTTGGMVKVGYAESSNTFSNKIGNMNSFTTTRESAATSGTLADDFDNVLISRESEQSGAGGTYTAAGSVLKLSNTSTETAGSLTDTTLLLEVEQDSATVATIDQTGTIDAAGGYETNGVAGLDDSSSYWLCTASDCATSCQVTVSGGIITGCT